MATIMEGHSSLDHQTQGERTKPQLKPLILVEKARSRRERRHAYSSSSGNSSSIASPSLTTEITTLNSFTRQGSPSNGIYGSTSSPILSTPPSKHIARGMSLEKQNAPASPSGPLQYHLPFRPIRSSPSFESIKNVSNKEHVPFYSERAVADQELTTINHTNITQSMQTPIADELALERGHADHRSRRCTETTILAREGVIDSSKEVNNDILLPSFISLSSASTRTRSSSTSSQTSWNSSASSITISPTDSFHPLRRSISLSSIPRSHAYESRGSYGTFGGGELFNASLSRSSSFTKEEHIEEDGDTSTADTTPKISHGLPAMKKYQFPTSTSPPINSYASSIAPSDISYPDSFTEGNILTATRVRVEQRGPTNVPIARSDEQVSALSTYVFPLPRSVGAQPSHSALPSAPIPLPDQRIPPRQRVLSSPTTMDSHYATPGRRALDIPSHHRLSARPVFLPAISSFQDTKSPRLPTQASFTPSHQSSIFQVPAQTIPSTPFTSVHQMPSDIPVEVFLRRGSGATVDSRTTTTSTSTFASKHSKLRKVTGLFNRLFERRGSLTI